MTFKAHCNLMIGISIAVLLFHLLVLSQFIDYRYAWGGNLKTTNEMYVFEFISIGVNGLLLVVVLQKASYIKPFFSKKILNTFLWLLVVIFAINTIGNLFALSYLERIFGTLFTTVCSYLCFKIVTGNSLSKKEP